MERVSSKAMKMRIAIIGRSELLYSTAKSVLATGHDIALVVTAKEAPEYFIKANQFEDFAKENNALFIYTAKLDTPEVIAKMKSIGPMDLAISINFSGIIPQNVIDLFKLGILNAHGGDLPRYRGNACQAWAIINGEDKIGLCIHKMIGGELDNGPIIARDYLPLNVDTRIGEVYDWMYAKIPPLMMDSVKKLAKDSNYALEFQSTDPQKALRTYPRLPEDGAIDFTKSNVVILRLINASSEPFAGAYCKYQGEKFIIWRARLFNDDEIYCSIPGQVLSVNHSSNTILIATGEGKLELIEVEFKSVRQPPSKLIKSIRTRLLNY